MKPQEFIKKFREAERKFREDCRKVGDITDYSLYVMNDIFYLRAEVEDLEADDTTVRKAEISIGNDDNLLVKSYTDY